MSEKCSATTNSGRPCRAWAVSGTDPPLCSAHAGRNVGAPLGNQNRLEHGFYSRYFSLQELADLLETADIPALAAEISAAKIAVRCFCPTVKLKCDEADCDLLASLTFAKCDTTSGGKHNDDRATNQGCRFIAYQFL